MCVSESAGWRTELRNLQIEGRVERKLVQNTKYPGDLGSILKSKRERGATIYFTFFLNISMSAEAAHRSDYLPFSSINFL